MITNYDDRAQKIEGGLAYDRVRGFVSSKKASGAIPFGRIVSLVSGSDSQVEVGGTGKALGFALRDHGQGMTDSNVGQYEDESSVSVIDKDYVIASTVSTAGDFGDMVFFDTSDGTITVADTPSATVRPIGYLRQTLTAAGLCRIYVDSDLVRIPFEVTTLAAATGGSGEIDLTWDTVPNQDNVQAIEVTALDTTNNIQAFRSSIAPSAEAETVVVTAATEYDCNVRLVYKDGSRSLGITATATSGA